MTGCTAGMMGCRAKPAAATGEVIRQAPIYFGVIKEGYGLNTKLNRSKRCNNKGEDVYSPRYLPFSYAGAALIPLFTLGIPTSSTIAVLLGAFIMHGLTPGPLLYQKNPDFVWAVIASLFIGNFLLS